MLNPGTPAPDLVLADQDGKPFTLSSAWRDSNVVLFFYPKAGTTVCTKEACAFRDAFADLQARNAIVVGISRDGSEAQRAFASQWNLPFKLLADVQGKAHRAYAVDSLFGLIPGRVTYVIGKGGVIRNAHSALLQSDGHVQDALNALD
jgi:peroxiredoxin Q/BCP